MCWFRWQITYRILKWLSSKSISNPLLHLSVPSQFKGSLISSQIKPPPPSWARLPARGPLQTEVVSWGHKAVIFLLCFIAFSSAVYSDKFPRWSHGGFRTPAPLGGIRHSCIMREGRFHSCIPVPSTMPVQVCQRSSTNHLWVSDIHLFTYSKYLRSPNSTYYLHLQSPAQAILWPESGVPPCLLGLSHPLPLSYSTGNSFLTSEI